MEEHLDEIDITIFNELKEYLDKHESQELDDLFDYIKDSLANGIYPYNHLYEAKDILHRYKQIEKIKETFHDLEAIEKSNMDMQEVIASNQKRDSKKF